MTQEEKDLLIKDLCSRLPYGVKCQYHHIQEIITDILIDINMFGRVNIDGHIKDICDIKPYLFPLSSMTEEQSLELEIITNGTIGIDTYSIWDFTGYSEISLSKTLEIIQWCYQNHFDINGLIPMGLAIDATGLNIY